MNDFDGSVIDFVPESSSSKAKMKLASVDDQQTLEAVSDLSMRVQMAGLGLETQNGRSGWALRDDEGKPWAVVCCEYTDVSVGQPEPTVLVSFYLVTDSPGKGMSQELAEELGCGECDKSMLSLKIVLDLLERTITEIKNQVEVRR